MRGGGGSQTGRPGPEAVKEVFPGRDTAKDDLRVNEVKTGHSMTLSPKDEVDEEGVWEGGEAEKTVIEEHGAESETQG